MIYLNIGLDGFPGKQETAVAIIKAIIGAMNVRAIVPFNDRGAEDTVVVDLYVDIAPGTIYRLAEALNQKAVAYWNGEIEQGFLIGPGALEWDNGRFNPALFLMPDGTILAAEARQQPVTAGERLMPGCECGAAAHGDFERCRCD